MKKQQKNQDNRILLQMNTFGPFIKKENITRLVKQENMGDKLNVKSLEMLFDRPVSTLGRKILNRYCEITTEETHLGITPGYKDIIEKIINPLRLAKRHYCLGEYISCIAISGLIGEMLTILVWKITEFKLHGTQITTAQEETLFGKKFEGYMGQERRINILQELKAIDEALHGKLYEVCKIRNKYLHSWERSFIQEKGDAKKVVKHAFQIFKMVININIVVEKGDQKISINPKLLKFFKEQYEE